MNSKKKCIYSSYTRLIDFISLQNDEAVLEYESTRTLSEMANNLEVFLMTAHVLRAKTQSYAEMWNPHTHTQADDILCNRIDLEDL